MPGQDSSYAAIVVPASSPNAYGIVRSLRTAGVQVFALDHYRQSPLRFSRLCRFKLCPSPADSESNFTEFLKEFSEGLSRRPVVFPTQDLHTLVLCRNQRALSGCVSFSFLAVDTALDCIDKRRMYPKACACGLDVPETHFPSNLQEMTLIAPTLAAFPYLVKPAAKFETRAGKLGANLLFYETYRTKALRCRDETELLAVFDDVCRHGVTPIVQQEIPGPASDLWAIDFYANRNSDIIQYHTGRKLRQYPSDFGTCTLGCTVERDELVGLAARVVKQLSFHGIGNVEFKQRDGKLYFLELNPRAWQWLHLATASGSNLPMTAYRDLTGGELPERSHKKRASVVWVDIRRDTEHVSLLKRGAAASDGLGILTWISSVRRARVEAISCLADPFPLIVVSAVRLWTRLVRRLLARPCREPLRHERDAQY